MSDIDTVDWGEKYAAEKYPNQLDWTNNLQGATISSVDATVVSGDIVITDPSPTSFSGALQTIHLSGGSDGPHVILASVTFDDGRILNQLIRIDVVETP